MKNINEEELFLERKIRFVEKEFETGFHSYQRVEAKVANLRQWTVTINLGFFIYMATYDKNLAVLTIVISVCMIIMLLLELRSRSSMAFDKKNIIEIEEIYHLEKLEEYLNRIKEYRFREEKLQKLSAPQKLICYLKSLCKGEVLVWYGMWLLIWSIFIFILRTETMIKNYWAILSIFVILASLFSYLLFNYFIRDFIHSRQSRSVADIKLIESNND